MLGRFAARRPHEADFAAFRLLEGDGLFLDVGANSGTSAMSFRLYKPHNEILSLEPSSLHVPDLWLTSKLVRRMTWMLCAAGDTPGLLTLHTPYYDGAALSHLAALDAEAATFESYPVRQTLGREADRAKFELRSEHTPVVRLDDLNLSPSFVKIDVQGFEMEVLTGLQRTLDAHRPVLLLEVGGDWEMVDHVRRQGYVAFHYEHPELRPFVDQKVVNLFFLPHEHRLVGQP